MVALGVTDLKLLAGIVELISLNMEEMLRIRPGDHSKQTASAEMGNKA
jgi:hypothetical protein